MSIYVVLAQWKLEEGAVGTFSPQTTTVNMGYILLKYRACPILRVLK